MKITFDPNDPSDVAIVSEIIGRAAGVTSVINVSVGDPVTPEDVSDTIRKLNDADNQWPRFDETVGLDLDANGTPWIEEVHSGGKVVNADGTWRKKRGTDDETVIAAEAAARAKLTGTPPAPDLPPVEVEQTTVPPVSFEELIALYNEKSAAGLIDVPGMQALYAKHGTNVASLATDESARAAIRADLVALTDEPSLPGLPA
jgi:hypothetical protein